MNLRKIKYATENMGKGVKARFERRSCLVKTRYKIEPICTLDQYAYPCEFCGGWHKATKREAK